MKQSNLKIKEWIEGFKDQGLKEVINIKNFLFEPKISFSDRIIGTVLITLSGILIYLDKVFIVLGLNSNFTFGFSDFYNFTWVLMQSLAPIFIILISIYFNPFRIAYLVPIYCYAIQVLWTFSPQYADDLYLTLKFSFGLLLLIILIIPVIKKMISVLKFNKQSDEEFIEETKEVLELLKAKILKDNL